MRDNGSGTDQGPGGVAFVVGDAGKSGLYAEHPSLKANEPLEGDLHPNYDFRGFYATLIERWMGLDGNPIIGDTFEQMDFL